MLPFLPRRREEGRGVRRGEEEGVSIGEKGREMLPFFPKVSKGRGRGRERADLAGERG